MYQSFESLDVWKRACRLATRVYRELDGCKDFGLKDQMTRAAVSIPSNIAEGYERGTDKDFIRFLKIAQGSAAELRTQVYIANSIGVISKDSAKHLIKECKGIGAMLQALAKWRSGQANDASPDAEGEAVDLAFDSPETGNPKPETDGFEFPEPRNPKPETDASRDAEGEAVDLAFDSPETGNPKPETDGFEFPEPRNRKPETDGFEFPETRNPKPETE